MNRFTHGMAPKIIADQVYQCLACPGSMPVTSCNGLPDGTPCTDGQACTVGDLCGNNGCVPGAPRTCTASDQCHVAGTCSTDTGDCSNPTAPDGTTCQDGNAETLGDTCSMGQCLGTAPCAQVAQAAAGGNHSCSLRSDRSLWCWGDGYVGQLGNGGYSMSLEPVRAGSNSWNWLAATAGYQHTCGIRVDHSLWCWGGNENGQLGIGNTSSVSSPEQVPGQGWTDVQAGFAHTCGTRSDGSLWCWGQNAHGELGDGTHDSSSSPVRVVGDEWVSVSTASEHTCGLKGDRSLWCWGRNADGRLGNGSTQDSATPVQVAGADWMAVSAGATHACGLKLDGSLWCWGANDAGQLGAGQPAGSHVPMHVGSSTWSTISAGTNFTCGVRTGGTLWCWGNNDAGQLGDGSVVPSLVPKQVVGPLCSQVPLCGDGTLDAGEECDDGNGSADDGCSPLCLIEKCFGVVCDPFADVWQRNECDPTNGQCGLRPQTGNACDDSQLCTTNDRCNAGTCGGDPKPCPGDACHHEGTCNAQDGTCQNEPIDRIGCNVNLRVDGVVNTGGQNWIAIFGWNSTATAQFHPEERNQVYINGALVSAPKPPAYLIPGAHPGGFLAPFKSGETIEWKVDGQSVTSTGSLQLEPQPLPSGGGQGVQIPNGDAITITPHMDPYASPPADPTDDAPPGQPEHGDPWNGALTGSLTTSPTGAAVYTVPMSIPPGIAGMAPNLSLVYSSQRGDGIAGQGWDLKGMSLIYRCAKTRSQDGGAKMVDLAIEALDGSDSDGVCIDGQRLFKVGKTGDTVYFEQELKDFSSIQYDQGVNTFTVVTKSGEVHKYGASVGSRVVLPKEDEAGIISPSAGITAIWALEKVSDPWGNYFSMEYNDGLNTATERDYLTRGLIVTKIRYTGHAGNGSVGPVEPFSTITLTYQPRPDVRWTRFRDTPIPLASRLKTIVTSRGYYGLKYRDEPPIADEDPMLPSLLAEIDYCAGNPDEPGPCLAPLTFTWEGGGYGWEESTAYRLPSEVYGSGTQLIDLDGDGLLDFVQARAMLFGRRLIGIGGSEFDLAAPLPHHRTCGSASGGSVG